jgi:hypothetical protein
MAAVPAGGVAKDSQRGGAHVEPDAARFGGPAEVAKIPLGDRKACADSYEAS